MIFKVQVSLFPGGADRSVLIYNEDKSVCVAWPLSEVPLMQEFFDAEPQVLKVYMEGELDDEGCLTLSGDIVEGQEW